MRTTEDRLRAALRGVGDTLGPVDVPPLELGTRRSSVRRWAAPLAVAAGLAAVIAGTVVSAGGSDRQEATPPAALAAKATGPKFYVSVGGDWNHPRAEVREAATGKVVSVLPPEPKGTRYGSVAAADNRTFFLSTHSADSCTNRFLRVQLDGSGRAMRVSTVGGPVKGTVMNSSLAVTADGSKLAYGLGDCSETGPVRAQIGVTTLATGEQRTWTSSRQAQAVSLSWAADGRTLGFLFMISNNVAGGTDLTKNVQFSALDTDAPGSDIFAARVLVKQTARTGMISDAVLAPDGRTVYAWLVSPRWGIKAPDREGLVQFVAGKPVRVLLSRPPDRELWGTLKIDSTGRHLLIERSGFLGRVDDGKFHDLPRTWPAGSQLAW